MESDGVGYPVALTSPRPGPPVSLARSSSVIHSPDDPHAVEVSLEGGRSIDGEKRYRHGRRHRRSQVRAGVEEAVHPDFRAARDVADDDGVLASRVAPAAETTPHSRPIRPVESTIAQ